MFSPRFSHSHHEQDHEDQSVMLLHIHFCRCTCRSAAQAAIGTVQHLSSTLQGGDHGTSQRTYPREFPLWMVESGKKSQTQSPNIMLAAGARITIKTCKVIPLISASYERYLFGCVCCQVLENRSIVGSSRHIFSVTFGLPLPISLPCHLGMGSSCRTAAMAALTSAGHEYYWLLLWMSTAWQLLAACRDARDSKNILHVRSAYRPQAWSHGFLQA